MIHYEWDVEEVNSDGDVIQHWFQSSYADCVKFICENTPGQDCLFLIVLVKIKNGNYGWWYAGTIDEWNTFHDANACEFGKVPEKYKKEVRLTNSMLY